MRAVTGSLYYAEWDINGDGHVDSMVAAPVVKEGDYIVKVIPKADADPSDTYTLEVRVLGTTIVLAQDVPIADVPSDGFGISWRGGVIGQFTPISIDIRPHEDPNAVNLKSQGVIPVAILTTDSFDAMTVDSLSVEFGPGKAAEAHGLGHIEDADDDGDQDLVFHFETQTAGIKCGQTSVSLTGKTFWGGEVKGSGPIKTVGCK